MCLTSFSYTAHSLTHVHVLSQDVFVHLPCLFKVEGCNPIVSLYEWNVYIYAWGVQICIPVKRDTRPLILFPAGKGQCVSETN